MILLMFMNMTTVNEDCATHFVNFPRATVRQYQPPHLLTGDELRRRISEISVTASSDNVQRESDTTQDIRPKLS